MNNSRDLWEYRLQAEDSGQKYQTILQRKFHFSLKLLNRLKQGEKFWVNGNFTYLSARGMEGDLISVQLFAEEKASIPGENLPLEILYEDDYLLGVNKPAGQIVHPTNHNLTGTLANAVVGYWERNGEPRFFRPLNRLDRNTSGVILVAKNQFASQQLSRQLKQGEIRKHYYGFVQGVVSEDTGVIDGLIGLAPGSFIKRQIQPGGQPARTHYRVLRRYHAASLLEFRLETGRTHQIRVHCEFIGHPLLGDDLYGGNLSLIPRQALHSAKYAFQHPVTGVQITVRAPFPRDLLNLLQTLT